MEMRPPLQADRLYMENRIEIQNMMAQMAQRGRKRIAFAGDKEHCQSFHERYLAYKDAAEHFGMATDWPTCATQKHSQTIRSICISRCAVARPYRTLLSALMIL